MFDMSVSAPAYSRRWIALGVLLAGGFLAPLDFFIVNVAMPAINAGLGAVPADTQLIISGYAVVFAIFLITGGRLGDMFGRKRVFLAGLAGFALASALCGLAWSPRVLVVSRLLQAMTAAAMVPQPLASIHALFPPHERAKALGVYSVTAGFASVVGQLLGGALVSANLFGLGWRLVFLINLPIALAVFIAAIPLVPDTRGGARTRLDLVGVVLSAGALATFIVPLIEGRELNWPWWCLALLAISPFFAEAFRRWEQRLTHTGGDPLVAMDIFAAPGLLRGLGALAAMYTMVAFFLTYAIYLQTGLGHTPLQAGLEILPLSADRVGGTVACVSGVGQRVVPHGPDRRRVAGRDAPLLPAPGPAARDDRHRDGIGDTDDDPIGDRPSIARSRRVDGRVGQHGPANQRRVGRGRAGRALLRRTWPGGRADRHFARVRRDRHGHRLHAPARCHAGGRPRPRPPPSDSCAGSDRGVAADLTPGRNRRSYDRADRVTPRAEEFHGR
jgi:MFS family permease